MYLIYVNDVEKVDLYRFSSNVDMIYNLLVLDRILLNLLVMTKILFFYLLIFKFRYFTFYIHMQCVTCLYKMNITRNMYMKQTTCNKNHDQKYQHDQETHHNYQNS